MWLLLVTLPLRTVGTRRLVSAFLIGVFPVTGAIVWLGIPMFAIFGQRDLTRAIGTPLLEESIKAAALTLIAWLWWRRRGQEPAVIDLALLGMAMGAGLMIHEDALHLRQIASPDGFFGPLFPFFLDQPVGRFRFLIAQAGWGAVLGVDVGLARLARHQPGAPILIVIAATALTTLDHAIYNADARWVSGIQATVQDVRLGGWVLILALLSAAVIDVVRRQRAPVRTPVGFGTLRRVWSGHAGTTVRLLALVACGRLHRAQLGRAYARADDPTLKDDPDAADVRIWRRRAALRVVPRGAVE